MDTSDQAFVESVERKYTGMVQGVIRSVNACGYVMEDLQTMTKKEAEDLVVRISPNGIKSVDRVLSIFSMYLQYVQNEEALARIKEISRSDVWQRCQVENPRKHRFISEEQFRAILYSIEMDADETSLNPDVDAALFQAIYEGIYSDDLSALLNLRARDIQTAEDYIKTQWLKMSFTNANFVAIFESRKNAVYQELLATASSAEREDERFIRRQQYRSEKIVKDQLFNEQAQDIIIPDRAFVTLHDDSGEVFDLDISKDLAGKLLDLAAKTEATRRNRNNTFLVPIYGRDSDSVFKFEKRSGNGLPSHNLYRILRRINKNFVGFSIRPYHLYLSGVMNQIKKNLEANGLSLEFAFETYPMQRMGQKIIQDELNRVHAVCDRNQLRGIVSGFIGDFD